MVWQRVIGIVCVLCGGVAACQKYVHLLIGGLAACYLYGVCTVGRCGSVS